jgi:hypothetical protein
MRNGHIAVLRCCRKFDYYNHTEKGNTNDKKELRSSCIKKIRHDSDD